jgi:mannose-1-phosphate guanylyltransferase/phosphomannomutase
MQAVIMAGGAGSRLRPLTSNVPKPMLPVANLPLMEHIVNLLRRHGFTDVVATVQFLSSVIRNYFGDGSDLGVSLSYSTEEAPLGTAGSVLNASELLSGTFLVISGDALTDLDLEDAIAFHRRRGAAATLVLKRMRDPLEFGIVMTAEDGRIERFLEKPTWGQVFSDTINTGIYVVEPEVLDLIPPAQPFDFSAELFPAMVNKGLPLFGYVTDHYWTDVGTSAAYLQAQRDCLDRRVEVRLGGFELRPGVWVGADADLAPTARLEAPVLIGDNCRVGEGAVLGSHCVLGANVIVGPEARVENSLVMERAHVGAGVHAGGAIVGRGATLQRGATLEEGVVLGDDVRVGAGALLKAEVKAYPSRSVEAGAIVTQSIVRERTATRSLFGSRGVAGLVNVGITPVVAVRLGMAYGTTLKRGSVVVTGRDASRAARTMKRALIAGLNSTGVHCHDLELAPMPVTRFTVRGQQASGGISVRTSPEDAEVVEIRLFDEDGADLSEGGQRRIERIFFREDYRQVAPVRLGELEFPPHAPEQYVAGLLRAIDLDAVRRARLKVVVDHAFGPTALLAPSIMGRLGCDALAVNAFADEHRPVLVAADLEALRARLCDHVRNSGSDLGVLLEPGGETALLVDDRGRAVSHERALLAFLRHEAGAERGTVAVPVSCPLACERLAAGAGARVQRTPNGLPALMAAASDPAVGFAGNAQGALIWPRVMPAPDALLTFCKALELVATAARPLSEIVDLLPEVHIERRTVVTPWQRKGAVMRRVASAGLPGELVLIDGVKFVQDDAWALVIPRADEPLCDIWAEGSTAAEARTRAAQLVEVVERARDEDESPQDDLSISGVVATQGEEER